MSELILMPTPNWLTSSPSDIYRFDGSIAFAAINSILLTNNLFESYNSTIKEAHCKRIIALKFSQSYQTSENPRLLASCSEDLDVKIWNTNQNILINSHKLHQV